MKNKSSKKPINIDPPKDISNIYSFTEEDMDRIIGCLDAAVGYCEEMLNEEAVSQINEAKFLLT